MEQDYIKLKEIKPALSGYIREALAMLDPSITPDDRAIHDVRVLMKKSRAVMRLIAGITDNDFFKKEYGAFREVGRIMCSWRDTSVHRKILKEMKKEHPGIISALKSNPVIESFLLKNGPAEEFHGDLRNELETISELLSKSSYRIRFRTMNDIDPVILLKELESSYKITAGRFLISRNTLKSSDLHEFRKRAKDFLYQLWFFRPLNPSVIKALEKKIDVLTQNLGKYNDLVQLINSLDYGNSQISVSSEMDEMILLIRQKQDFYLSKVWSVAYKIFRPGKQLVSLLGYKILTI
ncbi:MAG TPA: hypothetical protein DDW27_10695 [Bacteroidales bacterium]|nr:hypothetical protein [Bacteroidales bacterium]